MNSIPFDFLWNIPRVPNSVIFMKHEFVSTIHSYIPPSPVTKLLGEDHPDHCSVQKLSANHLRHWENSGVSGFLGFQKWGNNMGITWE